MDNSISKLNLFFLLAIEIADETKSSSLLGKSLFIKTTAIQKLGDYVNALPFAVWCKHLRPEVIRQVHVAMF